MKDTRTRQTSGRQRRRSRATLAWLATVAAAGLMVAAASLTDTAALAAAPGGTAIQDGNRAPGAQKRYRATRRIVVDRQTGQARMPTETEVADLVTTLNTLTKRTTDDLAEVTLPTGATVLGLEGGFAGVMLARPNEDGTMETLCVFTFEEGAEFLGLVEIQ